jgi:hypothetical protein
MSRIIPLLLIVLTLSFCAVSVVACPFCGAIGATFSEEIEVSDMAVFAKLSKLPPKPTKPAVQTDPTDVPRANFTIYKVLKGEKLVIVGTEITAIYFGEAEIGTKFLIYGASVPKPEWSTPIEMSSELESYLLETQKFPADKGERAVKVQPYLTSEDANVRQDAYNEFATTEYKDLRRVAKQFDSQQIRAGLMKLDGDESHLALSYSLLGIVGTAADIPLLEERLTSKDDNQRKRLDALIGCYLTLKGEAGLELIKQNFVVKDLEADNFTRVYKVLLALRFHGDDGQVIAKAKIAPVLYEFLKYPKYADLVIADLARWEDWSVIDRVMELYRVKDKDVQFVREPAARYMRTCPEPAAKAYLIEMQQLDPEAFKRAMLFQYTLPKAGKPADDKTEKPAEPSVESGKTSSAAPAVNEETTRTR